MQADLKELLEGYIKRVRELAEHVRGNEQATKQSLIGPLFTLLGWDLTDPRECVPEYRVDFGKDRSVKPIDWAFKQDGRPIFFVEAKEVGKKLVHYDEQLADYFAKAPEAKLGVLTNGVQWRFFTDVVNLNVMDREPFARWDVIADEDLPFDLLTLLQKSQFNSQLIRTYAERQRAQNLMVTEIGRLLEPSLEFIRLAVQNIETRRLTDNVLESWKPTLSNAINEWAKQRMLATVLEMQKLASAQVEEPAASKIVTTPEELEGFAIIQRLLGEDRPALYEDTVSYFKIHLPERYTWVFCRLYFDRKRPTFWVSLPLETVQPLAPEAAATTPQLGWTCITMNSVTDLESFGDVLRTAWDAQRALRVKGGEQPVSEPEPAIPSE
jgi:predicted type IV restriction endonuclease